MTGPHTIELAGETYTLVFDMAAFRHLEARTGIAILGNGIVGADFKVVGTFLEILHAGLLRQHAAISLEDLSRQLFPRDVRRLQPTIIAAIREATETGGEEERDTDPPMAQGSPGGTSGPSGDTTSDSVKTNSGV